jgi:hypothetical protein
MASLARQLGGQPMNVPAHAKRAQRTRIYFRLMDLCLFFAGVGLAEHISSKYFDTELFPDTDWAFFLIGVPVLFFNFVVPPILIVARFMRDEYAEQIWHRSIAVLAYIFAMAPLLMTLVLYGVGFSRPSDSSTGPFTYLFGDVPAGWLVVTIWMSFLLLWVGIFQFLRWRDGR